MFLFVLLLLTINFPHFDVVVLFVFFCFYIVMVLEKLGWLQGLKHNMNTGTRWLSLAFFVLPFILFLRASANVIAALSDILIAHFTLL